MSRKQRRRPQQRDTTRIENQKKLFEDKKLSLVLDLDQTLLHSIDFVEVDAVLEATLRKMEESIDGEVPNRHLFKLAGLGYWINSGLEFGTTWTKPANCSSCM